MRALLFGFLFSIILPTVAIAQTLDITPEELYAGGPDAPVIESLTHPDPALWYQSKSAEFTWELSSDITAVAAGVFQTSGKEPSQPFRPPINKLVVDSEEFKEGVNYLAVQFRNFDKWGMIAERKINIDDTAPTAPTIAVDQFDKEGGVMVKLDSSDQLSGLSHFELNIGDGQTRRIEVAEASRGYVVSLASGQMYKLTARAYDRAGNSSEATLIIWPTPYKVTSIIGFVEDEPASLLVSLMSFLLILMFGYLIYERLRYARALADLRKETADIHDQLVRIFSALREEIYDQIRGITKKSRISKGEQAAVEGLNKALSVSESLIKKEIKDVKKLLSK